MGYNIIGFFCIRCKKKKKERKKEIAAERIMQMRGKTGVAKEDRSCARKKGEAQGGRIRDGE